MIDDREQILYVKKFIVFDIKETDISLYFLEKSLRMLLFNKTQKIDE